MKVTVKKNTLDSGFLGDLQQCLNFLLKLEETKEHIKVFPEKWFRKTTYYLSHPCYRRFFWIASWPGSASDPAVFRTKRFSILEDFCDLPNDLDITLDAEEWQSLCNTQIWYKENVK